MSAPPAIADDIMPRNRIDPPAVILECRGRGRSFSVPCIFWCIFWAPVSLAARSRIWVARSFDNCGEGGARKNRGEGDGGEARNRGEL